MNEQEADLNQEEKRLKSKRYFWIDHARGFIMILLFVTQFLPNILRSGPARFFLDHPINQTTTEIMNFYDIGTAAFICIMGLLMPLSFFRRKNEKGVRSALFHMIFRYGFLLILGYLIFLIDQGDLIKIVDNMIIIRWDVIPTLGLVGLIVIPFLWIKPNLRVFIGFGMMVFYQIMVIYAGWREYAIASIHGGILGTIFGFSSLMIISSSLGEYLLIDENRTKKIKYRNYAVFGGICFIIGLILAFIPEWYANKRQVTLSYLLISAGTIVLLSFIFIYLDQKINKPIFILDSYGKNPFLLYLIAVFLEFLISDIIEYEIDFIVGPLMILVITVIAVLLDRYKKIIKI